MNLPIIGIIIIAAILIALTFNVIKGALKIAWTVIGILFFALILILGMVYMDARKMQGLLQDGEKTVLYQQNNTLLAGVTVSEGGFLIEGEGRLPENIKVLDEGALITYEDIIAGLKDHHEQELLLVVNDNAFMNMTAITLSDINISPQVFEEVMASNDPKRTVIEAIIANSEGPEELTEEVILSIEEELGLFSDDEFKSALFLLALSRHVQEHGERVILRDVKEERIIIMPDFWVMKLIKFMPDRVFTQVMERTAVISPEEEVAE